jgi:ubiquinone/menaquinone biosynthesis C-methylase UbiE
VVYVGGRAEAVPLRDGSVAAAWLAFVVHHVADLARCAAAGAGRRLVR